MIRNCVYGCLAFLIIACNQRPTGSPTMPPSDSLNVRPGSYGYDLAFLKRYKNVVELGREGNSRVLIIGDYQGRVMTSTAGGDVGHSYGWINYELIQSGKIPPHINPVGGEDRFWLGPEGGQFSLFFREGAPFDFEHWQTPSMIDTEAFDLVSSDSLQATFRKTCTFRNYSGFEFKIEINRQIQLLPDSQIEKEFGIPTKDIMAVAFESNNSITNMADAAWSKKTGLISIWILGMLKPTDQTTVVIPHQKTSAKEGTITDNYFGTIPSDRIDKSDTRLRLKGDGRYRGKVGISASIAKNIAGSFDAEKNVLTLVKFDLDPKGDYVNSKWEIQQRPFEGDVVNSYNDGPIGGSQMGPFYELESSSPVRELRKGDTLRHRHVTAHFEGNRSALDRIARTALGLSLEEISQPFQ